MKRIDYIDAAKGGGILLIVLGHIVPEIFTYCPIIYCFWLPLFFVLSGIVYNPIDKKRFIYKKLFNLLLPFIGWYFISYLIIGIVRLIRRSISLTEFLLSFLDVLQTNDIYNIPLWFLLCLFWMNILFLLINKTNLVVQSIYVITLAIVGSFIPNVLYIGSALSCSPFFFVGILLGKVIPKLSNRYDTIIILTSVLVGVICVFLNGTPPRLIYYSNSIASGNLLLIYVCGISLVISVVFIFKRLKPSKTLLWLGKNNLIILVTHCLFAPFVGTIVIKFIKDGGVSHLAIFIITMSLMFLIIPFCKRFLPFIVAIKK